MDQRDLISKLFTWSHPLGLKNLQGEVVMQVNQRLVGDLDIQKARMSALRLSREMRVKLRDPNSDEHIALIQPVDDLERDSLITLILVDSIDSVRQKIDQTFYYAEPTEPEEYATTEEHEEFAEKWSTWEADREKEYSKTLIKEMDAVKADLEQIDTESLRNRAINMRIDALCDSELKSRFIEMCVVLGTYEDDRFRKHLFESYQDYAAQPELLKNQLLAGYAELEMSTISLKESTKSQASEPESVLPPS